MKDETDWQRQLLVGVVVLVAVGALIGGIVAVISIKAADLAGIDDSTPNNRREDRPQQPGESTSTDDSEPTESDSTEPSDPGESSGSETGGTQTAEPPAQDAITLAANPGTVSTYERIDMTGTYKGPPGTLLQLQRKEGGSWVDFPISPTSVNGRTFATYIETGRAGANVFRMLALGSDLSSNVVTVQVG